MATSTFGQFFINEEKVNKIVQPIKKDYIDKKKIDKKKQDYFYVSIGKSGEVVRCPDGTMEIGGTTCIKKAKKFKRIIELGYKEVGLIF